MKSKTLIKSAAVVSLIALSGIATGTTESMALVSAVELDSNTRAGDDASRSRANGNRLGKTDISSCSKWLTTLAKAANLSTCS